MEHYPFLEFDNGLTITYSDLKKREEGSDYVTIYFEEPDESRTDFKAAQCDYPDGEFTNVVGYSASELNGLRKHVAKAGSLAMMFLKDKR